MCKYLIAYKPFTRELAESLSARLMIADYALGWRMYVHYILYIPVVLMCITEKNFCKVGHIHVYTCIQVHEKYVYSVLAR